ncbi:unnamed protein product [marine sediment metagenome]|uniref:Uncharacterized protein n=1 Tax=marine sediment metagenome TaxID=412755 RepID=X1E336_9ZZZZ
MVVAGLERYGIIKKQDIVATDVLNIEFGYVIYDVNYYRNITVIKDFKLKSAIQF